MKIWTKRLWLLQVWSSITSLATPSSKYRKTGPSLLNKTPDLEVPGLFKPELLWNWFINSVKGQNSPLLLLGGACFEFSDTSESRLLKSILQPVTCSKRNLLSNNKFFYFCFSAAVIPWLIKALLSIFINQEMEKCDPVWSAGLR